MPPKPRSPRPTRSTSPGAARPLPSLRPPVPQRAVVGGLPGWAWALAALLLAGALGLAGLLWWRTDAAASSTAAAPGAAAPRGGPPSLSMAELLAGHSADWRVARLHESPAVLVIEFPNLAEQGAAMNRLAALLEKADAPRDRVLGDNELAALIARAGDNAQTFYLGHDYEGRGLARFYALVGQQGLALNAQEQRLRGVLLAAGMLSEGPDGLQPRGEQALITFSATQADDPATAPDESVDELRRQAVLRHETSHGRYYTRAAYREHCRRFWHEALNDVQRELIRRYLATLGYDRHNEDLMLNEAQAFLMHTPDTRAFDAASVGIPPPVLAELRTRFWRSMPADAMDPRLDAEAAAAAPPPGADRATPAPPAR